MCNASDFEVHPYVGRLLLWLYCIELFLLTFWFLLQDACCAWVISIHPFPAESWQLEHIFDPSADSYTSRDSKQSQTAGKAST